MSEYKRLGEDWCWDDKNEITIPWNNFCRAVEKFHDDGYHPMMRRKTYDSHDKHFLKCLKIMVNNLEKHFEDAKYKG